MNESNWLVTWNGSWMDEISFTGQSVMTYSEMEYFKTVMEKYPDKYFVIYFGTNEEEEYTTNRYLRGCVFEQIPDNCLEFAKKHCNRCDEWSPRSVLEEIELR